jgi:cell division protein FtsW (lipid II flippase)
MGAALIIFFKPYVANRFAAYRHVWDFMDTTGYQQTRVLIYSASGGLFGLGIGEGKLRDVYAASTDLVFGLICEEMGLLIGIAVLLCFAAIAFFAIRSAKTALQLSMQSPQYRLQECFFSNFRSMFSE